MLYKKEMSCCFALTFDGSDYSIARAKEYVVLQLQQQ